MFQICTATFAAFINLINRNDEKITVKIIRYCIYSPYSQSAVVMMMKKIRVRWSALGRSQKMCTLGVMTMHDNSTDLFTCTASDCSTINF